MTDVRTSAQRLLAAGLDAGSLGALDDDELLDLAREAEEAGRVIDAARMLVAGEIVHRSRRSLGSDRLSARLGCRNGAEVVARVTKVFGRTARWRAKQAEALKSGTSLSGEVLPSRFPVVREAVEAGALGLDSAMSIVQALSPAIEHGASPQDVRVAEGELVATAIGRPVQDAPPVQDTPAVPENPWTDDDGDGLAGFLVSEQHPGGEAADTVALVARTWAMYLDPDGAVPDDDAIMRKRGITLGPARGETVPISGELMPEVAATLQRMFDAFLNPRVETADPNATGAAEVGEGGPDGVSDADEGEPDGAPVLVEDLRTPAQRRHDAFASMVSTLSGVEGLPLVGGAAPTLVVSVTPDQVGDGRGVAFLEGVEGVGAVVSSAVARQVACVGAVQRVVCEGSGRVVGLGSAQRVFTAHQRRAIALRDGGCVIPGCGVVSTWCEVHHVREHAAGGATHTDNGVLVCWFHHRTLDTSGWQIQMRQGVPWIRAPRWIDASRQWRPASGSLRRQWEVRRERQLAPRARSDIAPPTGGEGGEAA